MSKPDCGSVACTRGAATKLAVRSRLGSRTVEVMTFETIRMRTESQMLLGSQPQLTRVMRAVNAVANLAQSATTATMSLKCWVLR